MKLSCVFLLIVASLVDISIATTCKVLTTPPKDPPNEYEVQISKAPKRMLIYLDVDQDIICENTTLSKDFYINIQQFFDVPKILGLEITNSNSPHIESGAFDTLSMIPELRIHGAGIETIEEGAFRGLSNLTFLSLWNNSVYVLEDKRFVDLPNLRKMDLSYNTLNEIHENAFDNLTNLINLRLANNMLMVLPKDVFKDLENLTTLDLSRNAISSLNAEVFKNLTNLEKLILDDNQLYSVGEKWFVDNTKLTHLYITRNYLQNFYKVVFSNSLQEVHLNQNQIETVQFANSTKIEVLDLSDNTDLILLENSFANLEVSDLHLKRCSLGQKTNLDNVFKIIPSLQRVYLEENQIQSLGPNTFQHNPMLYAIILDNNELRNLTELPKSLEGIFANNNFLTSFDYMRHIDNFYHIEFSFNNVSSITYNFFDGLQQIKEVILANNKITTVSIGSFRNMRLLLVVDLSHNYIEHIELGTFSGAIDLTKLDLSHNRLTVIYKEFIYNLAEIEYIILSYNYITSANFTNTRSHLRHLKLVNVEGNQLSCTAILLIRKELGSVLQAGDNYKVSNVYGIPCESAVEDTRTELKKTIDLIRVHWTEQILSKQQTTIIILAIFLILVTFVEPLLEYSDKVQNFWSFLRDYFRGRTYVLPRLRRSSDNERQEFQMENIEQRET